MPTRKKNAFFLISFFDIIFTNFDVEFVHRTQVGADTLPQNLYFLGGRGSSLILPHCEQDTTRISLLQASLSPRVWQRVRSSMRLSLRSSPVSTTLVLVALALLPRPCAGLRLGLPNAVLRYTPSPARRLVRSSDLHESEGAQGTGQGTQQLSWLDAYARAELLAQVAITPDTVAVALRSPQLAMIGSSNAHTQPFFVTPENSPVAAVCPNAPMKKNKIQRRRPDDENDERGNSGLPVARQLAF